MNPDELKRVARRLEAGAVWINQHLVRNPLVPASAYKNSGIGVELGEEGVLEFCLFFFSSRRRHTRFDCDWSSDVCSSDLEVGHHLARLEIAVGEIAAGRRRDQVADAVVMFRGQADVEIGVERLGDLLTEDGRSEERRVGEECRSRWSPYHLKKKT